MEYTMNQDPKRVDRERYETMRLQSEKMKKKLLCIIVGVLAVIALLIAVIFFVDWIQLQKDRPEIPDLDITFYPPYEGDIMENEEYLGLNRNVMYCDNPSGYGLTMSVTDENREEFDANVLFLCDYVQTIIDGDCDAYNSFFNETYFKENDPKEDFSQQMVYNIKLRYYTQESKDLITYRLEYMIRRNDGTFRRDIGSDASRPQYLTLRVSEDGQISIERLNTEYNVLK